MGVNCKLHVPAALQTSLGRIPRNPLIRTLDVAQSGFRRSCKEKHFWPRRKYNPDHPTLSQSVYCLSYPVFLFSLFQFFFLGGGVKKQVCFSILNLNLYTSSLSWSFSCGNSTYKVPKFVMKAFLYLHFIWQTYFYMDCLLSDSRIYIRSEKVKILDHVY